MNVGFFTGVALKILGVALSLALLIGGAAALSGDLNNSDDIGGTAGDVLGAGLFGGVLGQGGMIGRMRVQHDIFSTSGNTGPAAVVPQSSKNKTLTTKPKPTASPSASASPR